MGSSLLLFCKLLIGHALADYPLQGDYIGQYKSWKRIPQAFNGKQAEIIWPWLMTSHAAIHAGFVWYLTGSVRLALAEFILHWLIDAAKCAGWTNFHQDQSLHVICKMIWSALA